MTKHLKLLSLTLIITHASINFAGADNTVCSRQGPITMCGKGVLDNLHVAGKATLSGTTVLNKTKIAGMLTADDASLNTLRAAGMVTLNRSKIIGNTKISGMLNACRSTFTQKITLSSDRMYLNSASTNHIQIDPGGDLQVLCIANESIVNGDIIFTSGQGIVAIDSSSKILGRVTGGKINPEFFNHYCEGVQTCWT